MSIKVALRKESVDRNFSTALDQYLKEQVALRKESVDRNTLSLLCRLVVGVALRKESVDRNIGSRSQKPNFLASLSARRAWIEILNGFAMRWNTCGRSPQGERG